MSLALSAYRAVTVLAEPLAPHLLRARARRGKEEAARLPERLGESTLARPDGRLAWLHGASVGEGLSLLPLVEALAAHEAAPALLVTSGTVTSAAVLGQRLPPGVLHQYAPVDAARAAGRFLDHWRPDLAVFAESELWPNLLLGARARGARTALVSARLSKGSVRGWARAAAAARRVLGGFDLVLAQDDGAAGDLARLGAPDDGRLNLKRAGAPLPADPDALDLARRQVGGRPLLLAASTHPGEEALILEVFAWLKDRPERPLLAIVPRHPVRGEVLAALARDQGFATARRGAEDPLTGATEVYVADTLGELGLWLRLARLAVVGGSLVAGVGGHNPLEPARLDCPAAAGPHVENWQAVYADLEAACGVRRVAGVSGLAGVLAEALTDATSLQAQAGRAKAFAAREAGAVDAAAGRLLALLAP